jgi:hypothetical protein
VATWPSGGIPTIGAGGFATSAEFNAFRDALQVLGEAWLAYTPTVSSNVTPPTMGASSIAGRVQLIGKTANVRVSVTLGSGFTAGVGAWTVTLPTGVSPLIASSSEALGFGIARHGTTREPFTVEYSSGTTVAMIMTSDGSLLGGANPFTWAAGDRFSFDIPMLEVV